MNSSNVNLVQAMRQVLDSLRESIDPSTYGLVVGVVLAEQHALETHSQPPPLISQNREKLVRAIPALQLNVVRERIESIQLDVDTRRQAWQWFLESAQRDRRGSGELISSSSVEEVASTVLLTENINLPQQPLLWSPCSGSGRIVATIGHTLVERGLKPKLVMWDINPTAIFYSSVTAFLYNLPAEVEQRNALTWNPRVEPIQADLIIADPPMGFNWESMSSEVESLQTVGAYRWGLPNKKDATWLFQQVVIQGLAETGRAVSYTSKGPLRSQDSEALRRHALESDQMHSIVLLPSGITGTPHIERTAVVWEGSKHKTRVNRISMINLKELFEEAPKGSVVPRILQRAAIQELRRALSDSRPTRISRSFGPEDFTFNIVETRYGLLEAGGSGAGSSHQIPLRQSVDEWALERYGSTEGLIEVNARRESVDLSGETIFGIRDVSSIAPGRVRLSCLISALRTRVMRGQGMHTSNQFGSERDGSWLVVRGGRLHMEDQPPALSSVTDTSRESETAWHFAFQVTPEVDAYFLQSYLEFRFGGIDFRSERFGRFPSFGVRHILTVLDDIVVPCPDELEQGNVIDMLEKLRMASVQLTADREAIWDGTQSVRDFKSRVDRYLGDEDIKSRLRSWPNPIASASWMVEISKNNPESQERALVRFWEAVSGFHATVLLSAIKGIPDLEQPVLDSIRSGVAQAGHLNLREASMGSFSLMSATCANQIRSRINSAAISAGDAAGNSPASDDTEVRKGSGVSELEQIRSAFGGLQTDLIERLVSKDLARLFEKLRPLRTSGAHGGAETRNQLTDRVSQMYDLVREWDVLTRSLWSEFMLVRGGSNERLDSHYVQDVEYVVGNDYPFSRGKVETQDAMKSGTLYMYTPSSWDFMELKAPLFDFMEVPEEAKVACYYFNRLRGNELDLKSFVYPNERRGSSDAPLIGQTMNWLIGDGEAS